MKTKAASGQSLNKPGAKFLSQMDEHWREIKEIRKEMRRSQSEIQRLKVSSRRKLAEIDAILSRA